MFWRKKQKKPKCEHHWIKALERRELVDTTIGGVVDCEYYDFIYAICSKCCERKRFDKERWEVINAFQSVICECQQKSNFTEAMNQYV